MSMSAFLIALFTALATPRRTLASAVVFGPLRNRLPRRTWVFCALGPVARTVPTTAFMSVTTAGGGTVALH